MNTLCPVIKSGADTGIGWLDTLFSVQASFEDIFHIHKCDKLISQLSIGGWINRTKQGHKLVAQVQVTTLANSLPNNKPGTKKE
mgnify:CR=1 FL=1